jgi:hypothetical protein
VKPAAGVATQTADTSLTSANYADMGTLLVAIAVQANSRLYCSFSCAYSNTSGGSPSGFQLLLDGVLIPKSNKRQTSWGTVDPEGVDIQVLTAPLSAGAHTVKVQWSSLSGANTVACNANQAASGHMAWLNVLEVLAP